MSTSGATVGKVVILYILVVGHAGSASNAVAAAISNGQARSGNYEIDAWSSVDERSLADLELRSIGPAVMGGRIDDIAVVEERPWILYVGTASGGLWKSINQGTTWTSVFDDQAVASIGDVALAPSDPEVIWIGTGEPNNRQSSTFGNGVYRSIDGGRDFSHLGLADTHHIGRIAVHPSDPDTAWVAALGHLWGANEERGVFRTSDGGRTWDKVLYIDENTGVADIALDPVNHKILYAAAYQRRRTPWGFVGGGAGSGLYKSTDGGDTWRLLTHGLPDGDLGRIGLDIYRSDPRIIYATVEHHGGGGIYRSQDRGENWERVNALNPRPMYYSQIRVDPNDDRLVYVLGSSFHLSDDAGTSFVTNREMTPIYDVGVHGDHHALWIDPANGDHLILGGDGGLYTSWDRSRTWDKVNNIPLAQFYAIGIDMQDPYWVYAGAQDTHSWAGPSATRNHIGILNADWVQTNFGDGMYQQVDPTDSATLYTESQGGNLVRFDFASGDRKSIQPQPEPGSEERYRFHWTSPILISPHDNKRLYIGGHRFFISSDRGDSWTASEDLTRGEDRDELAIAGDVPGPETLSRHDGVANWGTITTLSESSRAPGVIWVGTDDGIVQLSRNGGEGWTRLRAEFPGLDPMRTLVSRVAASHHADDRAYVTFDRHRLDDFSPYAFVTDDFGESWRSIVGDLEDPGWINAIVEHPGSPNLLFLGTETGLHVTLDGGAHWIRLQGNFPTVPVDDLVIHPRDDDLVVGTHGRSVYILDDLRPLVEMALLGPVTADDPNGPGDAYLFPVRVATQFHRWKHESYGGQRQFVGANPAYGAILTYWVDRTSSTPEEVEITIRDGAGDVVRTLAGPTRQGMNRLAWDLRGGVPEGIGGRGPFVPPGEYRLSLRLAETKTDGSETMVEVRVDPRARNLVAADHQRRYEFLTELNAVRAEALALTLRVDEIDMQVRTLIDRNEPDLPDELDEAARELRRRLHAIRQTVAGGNARMPMSLGGSNISRDTGIIYSSFVGNSYGYGGTFYPPDDRQRLELENLSSHLQAQLARLEELLNTVIPELNARVGAAGLTWIRARSEW